MLEKIIEILSEYTEADKEHITAESSLAADLELSSLDIMSVVLAFEEEFGIEIPDQVIKDFTTVGDLAEYLETK